MLWKRTALFALLTVARAAPAASPKDSRIAIRYGFGKVLIMGGEIQPTDEATSGALSAIYNKYPKLIKMVAGEWMNAVPPQLLQEFKPEPRTNWRIGDRWQLYPGAGPPITVVIETVVIIGQGGCGCFHDGAIARIPRAPSANQIAGLRASDYLVAPGAGLADVSQTPLYPLEGQEGDLEEKIRKALAPRAHDVLKNENWMISENPNMSDEEKGRIRKLNRGFLSTPEYGFSMSTARWAPPGGKPLLFTLALWSYEIDGKNVPVFAAEAILEEGDSLKVLSFQYREAEWMREPEFVDWKWDFGALSGFRNAWKIGNRYFFMRYLNGYEFAGVGLEELDPDKSIVETDLGYAF
jgi:hypothetical protein